MSGMYDVAKQTLFGAGNRLDLNNDILHVGLLNITGSPADYVYNPTNTLLSQITRYSGTTDQVIQSATIITNSPTVALDGLDTVFASVGLVAGKSVGGLIIYKSVTTTQTDPANMPILYVDGFTAVQPNGGNLTVQWDPSNIRIMSL